MTIEESMFRELLIIGKSCDKNCSKSAKTDCKLHRPIGIIMRDGKKTHCLAAFCMDYYDCHDEHYAI